MHVYHLNLNSEQIEGAKLVILPGDPFRVPKLAESIGGEIKEISWKREYRSFLVKRDNNVFLITSTGIGGPSTSIAIEELAMLGVKDFVRVGTTGSIQEYAKVGDVVISKGSVRLDGASTHYAPIEYPAVADIDLTNMLISAAKKKGIKYHVGITVSSDTFYPGQERYDSYSGYVIKRFRDTMKEWQKLGCLNYEMESSTLLTMTSALGLKGASITGIIVNRAVSEEVTQEDLEIGEKNSILVISQFIEEYFSSNG